MLQNDFKIALRNLWRDKFHTILNGIGLAVGMAAALLVFLWVNDELSFDNFHQKGDRIHRVLAKWSFAGNSETIGTTPLPLADATREQIPEVEAFVRMHNLWNMVLKHGDKRFGVDQLYLADKEFFDIFDFPFLQGDAATAFSNPSNIVLTASLAKRIFGTLDVVGQPLKLADKMELTVGAVMADVPSNSHLRFEALLPFRENYDQFMGDGSTHWGAFNFDSYVLLRPGVDGATVGKKMTTLIPEDRGSEGTSFLLQPLKDIYLHSDMLGYSRAPKGDLKTIRLIAVIGLLILLIACVNYVNLTTARSAHRAKATGIQKIVGANRSNLFRQYLLEAAVLVGGASMLAVVIANINLGLFEDLAGKVFTDQQLMSKETLLIILGTAILAVLLSGIQPAFQLSAFKPLETLRGNGFMGSASKSGLRKVLVTTQFVCSGALILGTLIMLAQMKYVKEQKLGYEKEHIFMFFCDASKPLQIKEELTGQPGVIAVTASDQPITDISNRYGGFDYQGKDPNADPYIRQIIVDEDFPQFFGLELQEGRWFLPGNADSTSFVLNEKALTTLGITDPIGKWINHNGIKGSIVGVAKDFHIQSLHHPIEQLIFVQSPQWLYRVYVKTTGEKAAEAIAAAEKIFRQHEPNALFNYQFLDEAYDELYKTETRMGSLIGLFASLAIFISCLGLFGLAAFTAECRTKEIGIRKVLGASISSLIGLLSKDFLKLVVIALVIASPIAWFFMQRWLQHFAYRIDIPWYIFVLGGCLVIGIAFLTMSFQSIKAALANPVKSLRSE
ncbi:MAG TPA: ABC transporter permease [Saprospiraceae bacterium]|nr:ABC transporter permease [Saprospiraceae bacterium]